MHPNCWLHPQQQSHQTWWGASPLRWESGKRSDDARLEDFDLKDGESAGDHPVKVASWAARELAAEKLDPKKRCNENGEREKNQESCDAGDGVGEGLDKAAHLTPISEQTTSLFN